MYATLNGTSVQSQTNEASTSVSNAWFLVDRQALRAKAASRTSAARVPALLRPRSSVKEDLAHVGQHLN